MHLFALLYPTWHFCNTPGEYATLLHKFTVLGLCNGNIPLIFSQCLSNFLLFFTTWQFCNSKTSRMFINTREHCRHLWLLCYFSLTHKETDTHTHRSTYNFFALENINVLYTFRMLNSVYRISISVLKQQTLCICMLIVCKK